MRSPFRRTIKRRDKQGNEIVYTCWYVVGSDGRFIKLDRDKETAFRIWERLKALSDFEHFDATIEAILEAWLRSVQTTVTDEKFADFTRVCRSFRDHCGPTTKAARISRKELLSWLGKPHSRGKPWSLSRRRDAGRIIQRAFRWAVDREHIPFSDLLDVRFQASVPRTVLVAPNAHLRIMTHLRSRSDLRPFATFLVALRHSGARPIQVREVTARNVIGGAWVFQSHKTAKKTGKPLIVRLTPCLQTLTAILTHCRPRGELFRNSAGEAWSKGAIVQAFDSLRRELAIEGVTAYSYRHTFATDALVAGLDVPTVAALMGHSDSSMVSRVYGHLDQAGKHLEDAVGKLARNRLPAREHHSPPKEHPGAGEGS